ncbi:putative serine/threonine-protein kinase STE20-like [Scaptodrosophila lebanonensis]|uniref:Serine/threonine-protein kinase STE20-like n=1 Tax=Drosophila lebanonensis TaxID=7225 RepID=A0A6J2U488_DROLE|nr:putative serine/threonine-protein kinase STE20-like [Scaptodrosophila lebanonensis]
MFGNTLSDYKIISVLGKQNGKFCTVYMGKCGSPNYSIAIKKLCLEKTEDKELQNISDEIILTRQFRHPNINSILHSFVCNSDVYIITPFMWFRSCEDLLENLFPTGFSEPLIALILRDVLAALIYIHKNGIIHGSIKAGHILLDKKKAVLTCFRESRCFINHGKNSFVIRGISSGHKDIINWTAPEVLDQNLNGFTEKCDLYSIGIACCEIANGIKPYSEAQPTFMFTEKTRGNVPSLLDQSTCFHLMEEEGTIQFGTLTRKHEIYSQRIFSDEMHQFAEICLNRNPLNRWSAEKSITHSFFKQCRYTSISDQLQYTVLNLQDPFKIEDGALENTEESKNRFEDEPWDF